LVGNIRAVAHLFRDGAEARDELDGEKVEWRERWEIRSKGTSR